VEEAYSNSGLTHTHTHTHAHTCTRTCTHTHNHFMALWILSGTTWVSQYQKKHSPNHTYHGLIYTKKGQESWFWHL